MHAGGRTIRLGTDLDDQRLTLGGVEVQLVLAIAIGGAGGQRYAGHLTIGVHCVDCDIRICHQALGGSTAEGNSGCRGRCGVIPSATAASQQAGTGNSCQK